MNIRRVAEGSKWANRAFVLLLYSMIIVDAFRIINASVLHMGDGLTTLFRNMVYIATFAMTIYACIRLKKILWFVIIACLYAALLAISLFVNQDILPLTSNGILLFYSRILPAFLLPVLIIDFSTAINKVSKYRWAIVMYVIVFLLQGINGDRYYYMNVGYNLMFPTLIIWIAPKRHKIIDWAICIGVFLVIMLYCARGTMLLMGVSIVMFFGKSIWDMRRSKRILVLFVLLLLLILLLPLLLESLGEYDLVALSDYTESRTIFYLLSGKIFDSSGRDNYYESGIQELLEHPLTVRGLMGDRVFYGNEFHLNDISGAFAHNFFLELMLQFGLIPGFVLTVIILILFIRTTVITLKYHDERYNTLYFGVCLPGMAVAMTTASYLSTFETGLMLGCCVCVLHIKKRNKYIRQEAIPD